MRSAEQENRIRDIAANNSATTQEARAAMPRSYSVNNENDAIDEVDELNRRRRVTGRPFLSPQSYMLSHMDSDDEWAE